MINLTIWLVAGSAIGWFASALMRTTTQRGIALNMLSGVVGVLGDPASGNRPVEVSGKVGWDRLAGVAETRLHIVSREFRLLVVLDDVLADGDDLVRISFWLRLIKEFAQR